MRTLDANHLLAQVQGGRTPYIHLVFTSADGLTTYDFSTDSSTYGNRILMIDEVEQPYSCIAYVMLQDYDDVVPDLSGYWTDIGYGDTYSGTNYYAITQRVWVKHQRDVYAVGRHYTLLELHGIWDILQEQLALLGDPPLYNSGAGTSEYTSVEDISSGTLTVFSIISRLILNFWERTVAEGHEVDVSVYAESGDLDGIIMDYTPEFDINTQSVYSSFDTIADLVISLLHMTKCYLRARATMDGSASTRIYLQPVYFTDSDSVDKTFYAPGSGTSPQYYSFTNRTNVQTPNHVVIYADYNDETQTYAITSEARDTTQQGKYMDVKRVVLYPNIRTQSDADIRAEVILDRLQEEEVTGDMIIPHDAALELYDYLGVAV